MARRNRIQLSFEDYEKHLLKIENAQLRAFNNYLRWAITEIRTEGLKPSSPLAFTTPTERAYDRTIEAMGFITSTEENLAATYRGKKIT